MGNAKFQEKPGTIYRRPLFFLSAGEPSGDLHAAELIRALRKIYPDAEFVGFGGPAMEKAGCRLFVDLTKLAVMWFGRALWNLPTFIGYLNEARRFFCREKPDLVILVDFPGFNWHMARRSKATGVRNCYYMPPQIWGWAQWRIKKTRRFVDHVLCPLPFETKWLQDRGVDAIRIGHPFFEECRKRVLDREFIDSLLLPDKGGNNDPILTVLPGSRNQEIANNLPDMLETVKVVRESVPHLRPIIAAFKESQLPAIREIMARAKLDLPVYVGRTLELIQAGTCALAVSGSVSMELLAMTKPTVIYYRIRRLEHFVMRCFRRVKYITLVNILAVDAATGGENQSALFYDDKVKIIPPRPSQEEWDAMLFPEFLTEKNRAKEAALPLIEWLTDPSKLDARRKELAELLQREDTMGNPVENAAVAIKRLLDGATSLRDE